MIILTKEQKQFFETIRNIQDTIVGVYELKFPMYNNMEDFLNDVTYETFCMLMLLIDGIENPQIRGYIIHLATGNKINKDIMLHDCCEDYLKCSDI